MFKFLEDSIDNALTVASSLMTGEEVQQRQVAKLIADGLSVAAIASATGLAVDVIESMVAEKEQL